MLYQSVIILFENSQLMKLSGFSLLELLIVIFMVSILSNIGIKNWQIMKKRSELSEMTIHLTDFLNEMKFIANNGNTNLYILLSQSKIYNWCFIEQQISDESNKKIVKNDNNFDCHVLHNFIPKYSDITISGIKLNALLIFYGKRNTTKAVTIKLKNEVGETRIIISVFGRIRYCSYRTYLTGISLC